jgi:hypothetical protein
MAQIVRTEKYVRGTVGKIVKWLFIGFNVLMLIWVISAVAFTGHAVDTAHNEAEQAGAAVGGTIAIWFQLTIWVFGDIILGLGVLFTRGKKVIVEETTG